jgi:hypothetical protein
MNGAPYVLVCFYEVVFDLVLLSILCHVYSRLLKIRNFSPCTLRALKLPSLIEWVPIENHNSRAVANPLHHQLACRISSEAKTQIACFTKPEEYRPSNFSCGTCARNRVGSPCIHHHFECKQLAAPQLSKRGEAHGIGAFTKHCDRLYWSTAKFSPDCSKIPEFADSFFHHVGEPLRLLE